jgi:GNAT superfamily N-acetyltransferase
MPESALTFQPVTPANWADFEALFGPKGAMAGCWCMWWRVKRKDWEANQYEGNRAAMKAIVDGGTVPGLLAYEDRQAVGWVSVAPREDFPVLQRSPVLKPVDDQPVWSVVCFYVQLDYRGQGLTRALLDAAVAYAHEQGATLVEGYPYDPGDRDDLSNVSIFTGLLSIFEAAGFREVARRSEKKPIVRLDPTTRG